MPVDPTPGSAYKEIRIIKQDDPNFKKGGGSDPVVEGPTVTSYKIGPEFVNPVGMPSGPGFDGGKRKKRGTKTFPRGILRKTHKVIPSKNPSKAPPTRKRAVLIVSEKKIKEARKTAKHKAAKTDIATIRRKLIERKIISPDKKNIPPNVLRVLYADSVGAGLMN
jgi:hypothetical protein